jgi:DNA-binding CsgD family transcriptional regulator
MIGFSPGVHSVTTNDAAARLIIQQQIRDIVSGLSQSTVRSGRRTDGPAAIRVVAIGDQRYRLVVDLLVQSDDADPVPIATVERIERREAEQDRLRKRFRLTEKETLVALLLAQRRSNAEIADTLSISPHTARRHTENVMLKLNVTSRFSVEDALAAA